MDVHQMALLARQPSARVTERATFLGMPKRLLAVLLVNVMFWQPLWAQADGIAVSGTTNTQVGKAGNGVPVINIAAPNGAGLSHNQFKQYNVDRNGVILNNSTQAIQATQLGGNILGNDQLKGRAANTILNEVTGANATQLRGYTEVAGQSARVIVANPDGISCNGCGFINTPRVTLSTGKPELNASGKLERFAVDGGSVSIDGQGLDASRVDQFDIITRSAKINADIHAKQLNVIAGANDVDADTLATRARTGNPADKPQLAIDSSALGGMYADTIKLVGTERGVGVKTAGNLAASAGDIQLDANGHLNMAQASAKGTLDIKAASVELTGKAYAGNARVRTPGELSNAQSLATRDSIDISAGSVRNAGTLAAGVNTDNTRNAKGDLRIDAAQVSNSGSLEASRRLSVKASEAVDNRAVMQAKTVELSTAQLTNQGKNARIVGEQALVLATPAIVNLEGVIRFGNGQDVSLQLDRLENRNGLIQTGNASLAIKAKAVDNQAGQIDASRLSLDTDTLDNRAGLLSARSGNAQINARSSLDNSAGTVQAQQRLSIDAGELINQNGRLLAIAGDLRLSASSLDNRAGRLLGAAVDIAAPGARIDNRGGKIVAERIDLRAAALDNREQGLLAAGAQGLALMLASQSNDASQPHLLNRGGQLQSEGALALSGAWLDNSGGTVVGKQLLVDAARLHNDDKGALVSDGGDIRLNVGTTLSNLGGVLDAGNGALVLRGGAAVDNQAGSLRGKQLDLAVSSLDNSQQGQLVAGSGGLNYSGNLLDNDQGSVLARGGQVRLDMAGGSVSNLGGAIQGDSVLIDAARLSNGRLADDTGSIASLAGDLTLNVGNLSNSGGQLFARYALAFQGDRLSNTGGAQLSGEGVRIAAGQLDNQGGLIEANSSLTLSGATLDNRGGQLRALGNPSGAAKSASASDLSSLDFSERIDNSNGRIAVGSSALRLKADALDNRDGSLEHAGAGLLTLDFKRLNGAGGSINALGSGDWQFGSVDGLGKVQLNKALTYTSDALALQAGDRLASGSDLTLNLRQLDNAGDLLSDGNLQLNLSGDLSNSGRLSAQRLIAIKANQLTQNGGRIGAGSDLRLELAGNLDNLGFLTARNTLSIDAARIDNRGTLGAQGAAILSASQSINNGADALLFSGGGMALRSAAVNNLYGDLYSVGDLSVAGLDGAPAQRFSNLSGTVESQGAISLNAAFVENAKAEFELGQTVVSGSLSWVCGQHCKGHDSFKRGEITIEQTLLETAVKDSPSARLVAGKDLTINADQVQNRYSLLAANGNLGITANDLLNLGASERTGHEITVIGTPGRIDTGYWDQMEYIDVPAFNAAVAAGNFDLARFELLKSRSADSRFAELSHDLPWTDKSPPLYAATLQAGGTVNLNVARSVQNGAVSEHNVLEILTGALGDDQTSAPLGVLELTLNKQAEGANSVGIGSVTPVKRVDADGSVQTGFTPVDYSGIPFVSVDPTQGATFQLPKGEYGLFIRNPDPTSNYLIETNPKLTDLSQFLGSDYLLDRLKIDPDNNWRRLGDGLYEQRLIRDAVLAQTGQRFLANGLASDYDQYRYLMDNAVASKDALNLSLGVSLNAEQVGALTHDIVWMENRVVEGQKVLVPVLYLAKADARNVRGNSLIQGRDLNLISGGDLINVGTLRASNDLNVASGGSIYQGGLVEAGNNLQMLAQDSIRNAMAGEIRGERVSLTAVKGDILNERTAIKVRDGVGYKTFTDVGSGISAGKDLTVSAGRDITNYGSVRAGNTATLQAGGDVNLLAKTDESQKRQLLEGGHRTITKTQARQLSSSVAAGSDLNTAANRDINVVASRASAGKDLALDAGRDVNIASAQNEDAYSAFKKSSGSFGRKKTHQEETYDATNVASKIEAGQDLTINTRKAADGGVSLSGGRDVNIVGSQLSAGNDLILGATSDVSINAAAEQHGTYSKTTKSGSFGLSKSGKSQMTSNVAQVGSELSAGNDAVIATGRDVNLRGSSIEAGRDADLRAGLLDKSGDINLLSANQEAFSHQEKYKKKTGLSLSGGFLSIASAKEAGNQAQDVTSVGSQIDAMRNAYLRSERDINVVGSRIDAGDDIGLQAGRDVNVLAAQNSHSSQDWKSKKQTGIGISSDDNGVTLFAGNERNKAKDRLAQETSAASQISAGGNLDVAARRDINQVGSDLQAFNDIRLAAGRDVNIDAARESQVTEQMRERSRNGLSATINHNFGNTKDAVSGAGKGEDATSKASSTLRAVDSISQFLSGPTADAKFGNSRESSRQIVTETSNRPSTLDAGNDLNIAANNAVRISGGQLQSGRDINIQGRDVTLDAAKGSYAQESSEQKSWSGIHGGTSGGFKIGVGGSRGVADNDQSQGNSTVTALQAGRDANLKASNDLNLIGTQIQTQRDINLGAGNTLNITAAQNDSETNNSRRSGGGEVGLAIGSEGVGFYASVNMGKGNLEREGEQQQEAYLYAGNQLAFTSGQDTNIGGATLRGKDVVGRVGRDLNVSSLPDTGKVQGKEFDLSATVVVGPGSGASGSVGYGKTTGDKNWVEKQTSITAQDKLDLRTGNHTQLDGALIASDTGNLKLDTNTLGFSDIAGKDKEHGYYLNVGGSYGIGKDTTQDPSQVGKGDNQKDGWSVEGWNYNKDRQQIVRGTVGAGEVVVRADRDGQDSTTGLNRDVDRAYEVTKDDERRTDLYVTKSSVDAVRHTPATVKEWARQVKNYDETAKQNYEQASRNLTRAMNKLESSLGRKLDTQTTQRMGDDFAENTLDGLLQAGLSPRQAKELMADHDFQKTVVEELANLSGIDVGPLRELTELTPGVIELAESLVTPENSKPLTISQETLRSVVELNKYVQAHPEQEETIGVLIAVTQGPKGLAQMAVRKAVDQTPYGKKFNEWVEKLNENLGKRLADYIENKDLDKDLKFDNELIGGGKFMTSVLTGALPGRKGGGERRAVSVESGHKGGGQGGSEKGTGAEGTKGIPSISRSTEITELFSSSSTRSGIQIGNRSLIEVPNTGNAKIFSGATDVEVKQYFSQLTGSTQLPSPRSIPGKGDIYVVNTPEGNFTLRNFSSSSGQTGPAWTIDVPKAAAGTTYNPEIKFLIGNP